MDWAQLDTGTAWQDDGIHRACNTPQLVAAVPASRVLQLWLVLLSQNWDINYSIRQAVTLVGERLFREQPFGFVHPYVVSNLTNAYSWAEDRGEQDIASQLKDAWGGLWEHNDNPSARAALLHQWAKSPHYALHLPLTPTPDEWNLIHQLADKTSAALPMFAWFALQRNLQVPEYILSAIEAEESKPSYLSKNPLGREVLDLARKVASSATP